MARASIATFAELTEGVVIQYGVGRAKITLIDKDVPKHWPPDTAMVHLCWTSHRSVPQRCKGKDAGSMAVRLDWSTTVYH